MAMQITQITKSQAWGDFCRIERAVRYCEKMHQWHKKCYFYSPLTLKRKGSK